MLSKRNPPKGLTEPLLTQQPQEELTSSQRAMDVFDQAYKPFIDALGTISLKADGSLDLSKVDISPLPRSIYFSGRRATAAYDRDGSRKKEFEKASEKYKQILAVNYILIECADYLWVQKDAAKSKDLEAKSNALYQYTTEHAVNATNLEITTRVDIFLLGLNRYLSLLQPLKTQIIDLQGKIDRKDSLKPGESLEQIKRQHAKLQAELDQLQAAPNKKIEAMSQLVLAAFHSKAPAGFSTERTFLEGEARKAEAVKMAEILKIPEYTALEKFARSISDMSMYGLNIATKQPENQYIGSYGKVNDVLMKVRYPMCRDEHHRKDPAAKAAYDAEQKAQREAEQALKATTTTTEKSPETHQERLTSSGFVVRASKLNSRVRRAAHSASTAVNNTVSWLSRLPAAPTHTINTRRVDPGLAPENNGEEGKKKKETKKVAMLA